MYLYSVSVSVFGRLTFQASVLQLRAFDLSELKFGSKRVQERVLEFGVPTGSLRWHFPLAV